MAPYIIEIRKLTLGKEETATIANCNLCKKDKSEGNADVVNAKRIFIPLFIKVSEK